MTKKAVELKEEELEKVSGGSEPANIVYAYSINQKVIDSNDWILTIITQAGWNPVYKCPKYTCVINELPNGYCGA